MKRSSVVWLALLMSVLAVAAVGCSDLATTTSGDVLETTTVAQSTTTVTSTTIQKTEPPTNWDKLTPAGEPSARSGHVMVDDPTSSRVLLFGGGDGMETLEAWGFDCSSSTWTELHPAGVSPSERWGAAAATDPVENRVLFFGGHARSGNETVNMNDLWAFDCTTDTWTELRPSGDLPMQGDHLVYDSAHSKFILVDGGMSTLWTYDPAGNTWTKLSPSGDAPPSLSGCAVALDQKSGKVVLFGGEQYQSVPEGEDNYEGPDPIWPLSIWTYDLEDNSWAELRPGGTTLYGRGGHAMVYHPGCEMVLMFGGSWWDYNHMGGEFPGNLVAYDSVSNTWSKLDPADRIPFGREGHAMAYDYDTGKVVMFGGVGLASTEELQPLSGTWILTP